MSSVSISLIRQLQKLERLIDESPNHLESLQEARARGDRVATQFALLDAERHLSAMAITTNEIKNQVFALDDFGSILESLSELMLRAVRLVILVETKGMRLVMRGRAASKRLDVPFGRRRISIPRLKRIVDELTCRVESDLHTTTSAWMAYRTAPQTDRDAFRQALRDAEQAMCVLGNDPELTEFLRDGAEIADWPTFADSCGRLRTALAIRIYNKPDKVLLEHSEQLRLLTKRGVHEQA